MKTAYEYRREILKAEGHFGRESEMLLSWAKKRGAESNNAFEALLEVLKINGAKADNIEDAWDEIYLICNLEGGQQDRAIAFWRDLNGEFPIRAIMGWTCEGACNE